MRWIPLIGCWMIAASALAGGEVVLFSDDFSADMGWTGYEAGYWERGSAVAGGGTRFGNPDPGPPVRITRRRATTFSSASVSGGIFRPRSTGLII